MPNYTTTIVKIFLRPELAHTVPAVVAALAAEDADTTDLAEDGCKHSRWIDFERLLPVPASLNDYSDEYQTAVSAVDGIWPNDVPKPQDGEIETGELYARTSESAREMVRRVRENISLWGAAQRHEWCEAKWHTKANADAWPPVIGEADEHPAYGEFPGATYIHYSITTAWTEPAGWLTRLSELCAEHGAGLRCWTAHEEGGSIWNPATEEYQTNWTHEERYDVDFADLSASDLLVLSAGEVHYVPAPGAMDPIETRDVVETLLQRIRE